MSDRPTWMPARTTIEQDVYGCSEHCSPCDWDLEWLIAEVERLGEIEVPIKSCDHELLADNARLRAALEPVRDALDASPHEGLLIGQASPMAKAIRKTLGGEPTTPRQVGVADVIDVMRMGETLGEGE